MIDLIIQFAKFLRRRDSESAACVCIIISSWMDSKDLRDIADYFKAVKENRKCLTAPPSS